MPRKSKKTQPTISDDEIITIILPTISNGS